MVRSNETLIVESDCVKKANTVPGLNPASVEASPDRAPTTFEHQSAQRPEMATTKHWMPHTAAESVKSYAAQ